MIAIKQSIDMLRNYFFWGISARHHCHGDIGLATAVTVLLQFAGTASAKNISTVAQNPTWKHLRYQAQEAARAKDYSRAAKQFDEALKVLEAKEGKNGANIPWLLEDTGMFCLEAQRIPEGIKAVTRALKLNIVKNGEHDVLVAARYRLLGRLNETGKNYKIAIELFQKAILSARPASSGGFGGCSFMAVPNDHAKAGLINDAYLGMAECYQKLGDPQRADQLYKQAIDVAIVGDDVLKGSQYEGQVPEEARRAYGAFLKECNRSADVARVQKQIEILSNPNSTQASQSPSSADNQQRPDGGKRVEK